MVQAKVVKAFLKIRLDALRDHKRIRKHQNAQPSSPVKGSIFTPLKNIFLKRNLFFFSMIFF